MDHEEIVKSLRLIRETMESTTRYTNIPPLGYIVAGLLGLLGPAATWWYLGPDKAMTPSFLTGWDVAALATIWLLVLGGAVAASVFFTIRRARAHNIRAWNSLARRMYFAQIPQLVAGLALTIGLTYHGLYLLIPALWLLEYGCYLFAFSSFTGRDHLIQGGLFLGLGVAAIFASGPLALKLLAAGFGGVNLAFGVKSQVKEWFGP